MKKCTITVLCFCILCLILTPVSLAMDLPFSDVHPDNWFYQEVQYVYQRGLMNGTTAATFTPDGMITRGMIVAILHRLEKTPSISAACPFQDVGALRYDREAITWAAYHGIVNGYTLTQFAPDDPLTRQQLAAILYRFSVFKGYNTSRRTDLSRFADTDQISAYAVENMSWANAEGLINGTAAGELLPKGHASRAQTAVIVTRFCKNIVEIVENTETAPTTELPDIPKENAYHTADTSDAELPTAQTDNSPISQGVSGRGTSDRRSSGSHTDDVSTSKNENVFRITAEQSPDGKTVEITVSLDGTVHLCGFDMALRYETDLFSLHHLNTSHDLDIISAIDPETGTVTFNYAGVKNITKTKTILTASFDVIGDAGRTGSFILFPEEVVETDEQNNVITTGYHLVSQTVSIH